MENIKYLSLHLSPPLKATPSMKMEILREFLESSTIHGLTYISTARVSSCGFENGFDMYCYHTLPVKVLWCVVVCLGFLGAGVLIGKSYKEWQNSPIATSITTHSVYDLDFPIQYLNNLGLPLKFEKLLFNSCSLNGEISSSFKFQCKERILQQLNGEHNIFTDYKGC